MIVILSAASVLWVNVRAHSPRPNQLNIRIDTDSYAKIFAIICPRLRKLRLSNYKTRTQLGIEPNEHQIPRFQRKYDNHTHLPKGEMCKWFCSEK